MTPDDIHYALARQVPDMARGFTIGTHYGDIAIEAGWAAQRLQTEVARVLHELQRAHKSAEKRQQAAQAKAAAMVTGVFGGAPL